MANLTLGLAPGGEVTEIQDATLKFMNGQEAHVTMHFIEASRRQIGLRFSRSLDAFFDFCPEI